MAKIRATIVLEYEVPDDPARRLQAYDTTDLDEMAKVDEVQLRQDPGEFVSMGVDSITSVTVEGVK